MLWLVFRVVRIYQEIFLSLFIQTYVELCHPLPSYVMFIVFNLLIIPQEDMDLLYEDQA